jgi:TolB-like protein/Flp pilus assembly protein TadD
LEQEYFCDGLTEDLTTALTAIPDFTITARNTMFAFKGKRPDVRQLGRDLGLSHILEGSVRKAGRRIRVNVQLIETVRGENLWAKKFDNDLAGVFEIQDEIVRNVVTELDVRLAQGEQARLWRASTDNAEAYDLFLRARACAVNPEGFAREIELLDQALALDPQFTAALCFKGYVAVLQAHLGWVEDREGAIQKANDAFKTALRLDDRCADAHAGRGMILFRQGRIQEAEKEYELALSLGPVLESTHTVCAGFYACKKDFARALRLVRRAKELSRFPLSQTWAWEICCLRNLGRLEEALDVARRALELFPDGVDILVNHANVCRLLGLRDEIDASLKRVLELQPDFTAEGWVAATGAFNEQEQREYAAALHEVGFP